MSPGRGASSLVRELEGSCVAKRDGNMKNSPYSMPPLPLWGYNLLPLLQPPRCRLCCRQGNAKAFPWLMLLPCLSSYSVTSSLLPPSCPSVNRRAILLQPLRPPRSLNLIPNGTVPFNFFASLGWNGIGGETGRTMLRMGKQGRRHGRSRIREGMQRR